MYQERNVTTVQISLYILTPQSLMSTGANMRCEDRKLMIQKLESGSVTNFK